MIGPRERPAAGTADPGSIAALALGRDTKSLTCPSACAHRRSAADPRRMPCVQVLVRSVEDLACRHSFKWPNFKHALQELVEDQGSSRADAASRWPWPLAVPGQTARAAPRPRPARAHAPSSAQRKSRSSSPINEVSGGLAPSTERSTDRSVPARRRRAARFQGCVRHLVRCILDGAGRLHRNVALDPRVGSACSKSVAVCRIRRALGHWFWGPHGSIHRRAPQTMAT
jgi:hypothetical protein